MTDHLDAARRRALADRVSLANERIEALRLAFRDPHLHRLVDYAEHWVTDVDRTFLFHKPATAQNEKVWLDGADVVMNIGEDALTRLEMLLKTYGPGTVAIG